MKNSESAAVNGNIAPMDLAGVIWMSVFGILFCAAALAGGIFIYRFISAMIKDPPADD